MSIKLTPLFLTLFFLLCTIESQAVWAPKSNNSSAIRTVNETPTLNKNPKWLKRQINKKRKREDQLKITRSAKASMILGSISAGGDHPKQFAKEQKKAQVGFWTSTSATSVIFLMCHRLSHRNY